MSKIKTSCEKCVFRKDAKNGDQFDCELGRLRIFLQQDLAEFDDKNRHYVINRFCNTCRDKDYTPQSILEEVKITCSIIVDGTQNEYWDILKSITKMPMLPKNVFVAFNDIFNKDKYYEFQEIFNNLGINLTFKKYFENKQFENMIDDIVNKCKTQFYIPICQPIEDLNIILNFNYLINYDLKNINAVITPDYYNSIISCTLHKIAYGNNVKNVTIKLKEYLETIEDKAQKETIIFK